jgi:hypothetical protein
MRTGSVLVLIMEMANVVKGTRTVLQRQLRQENLGVESPLLSPGLEAPISPGEFIP